MTWVRAIRAWKPSTWVWWLVALSYVLLCVFPQYDKHGTNLLYQWTVCVLCGYGWRVKTHIDKIHEIEERERTLIEALAQVGVRVGGLFDPDPAEDYGFAEEDVRELDYDGKGGIILRRVGDEDDA